MEEIYVGKRQNSIVSILGKLVKILIIFAILFIFFLGIDEISSGNKERQQASLQEAVDRDIVQCYSLEGIYPPSLEYMEEHYGLIYDKKLFFIDYRPVASNIYPEVTIIQISDN